ncbi:PAS domain-containing protein [Roseomonas sp. SSH11]|uniref:histidine kinase n=1 Tax=Pararoseomonas baculiformis TaxID=2820812 RepID=A0ABS4AAZ2_9PROT|nr:PAS domain-containing protein [Pararoseomonas baculiformis]MBP0443454.1 PAS domain-containing protein [Pararoseomonas baculiformis]
MPDDVPTAVRPSWAEQRLALALEASGIAGAWDWDAETDLIHGDARACTLHGIDPATGERGAPGPELLVHVVPEDRPALDRALASALAGRAPLNITYRVWPPGGDVIWVLLRGRVLRDATGMAQRLAGVALDISEQKDKEAALRESEARFRTIADTMPQAVWSTRPDGHHDYYNRRWYELTGTGDGDTDGVDWEKVVHADDRATTWERWRQALATGKLYEVEYRLRMADGSWRWFLGRALPVRDARGRITRWFGTCTDIHDLRRVAEEREVLSHELSHRIKNIFSVIASLVSLTARGHPEAGEFAGELRGRINALARAHEFARPHSDGSRPERGGTTLFHFLADLLSPYDPSPGGEKRITISGDDQTFDDAAATPLALLFHELATNAAKYGALSRPGGRVAIQVLKEGEELLLRWRERGGPEVQGPPEHEGFGTRLAMISVQGQLGGKVTRVWPPEGLELEARLPPGALERRSRARQQA